MANGDHDGRVDAIHRYGRRVVAVFSWADSGDKRHTWTHALELDEGTIVDIQDYASPTLARAATGLRAILG